MSANSQILVVDDDPMSQRVISQCLETKRFRVRYAMDGESGLAGGWVGKRVDGRSHRCISCVFSWG